MRHARQRWALGPRQQGARLAVRTEAAYVADSRSEGTEQRESRKRRRGGSAVRPARDALRPPVPTLAEGDPLPPMEDGGVLPLQRPLETEEGSVRKRANNFLRNWHKRTLTLDAPTHTATFYTDARKRKFNRQVFLKTVRDLGRCDGGSKSHCFQVRHRLPHTHIPHARRVLPQRHRMHALPCAQMTVGEREMVCSCDSEEEADHWVERIATYSLMDVRSPPAAPAPEGDVRSRPPPPRRCRPLPPGMGWTASPSSSTAVPTPTRAPATGAASPSPLKPSPRG